MLLANAAEAELTPANVSAAEGVAGVSEELDMATDSAARTARLDQALAAIAAGAAELDRAPRFPREASSTWPTRVP